MASRDDKETHTAQQPPVTPASLSTPPSLLISNIINGADCQDSLEEDVAQALQRKLHSISGSTARERPAWHRWLFGTKAPRRPRRYRRGHDGDQQQAADAYGDDADTNERRAAAVIVSHSDEADDPPSKPIVIKVRKRKAARESGRPPVSVSGGKGSTPSPEIAYDASHSAGVATQDYGDTVASETTCSVIPDAVRLDFAEPQQPALRRNLSRLQTPPSPTASVASIASYVEVQGGRLHRDSDQDTIPVSPPLERTCSRHGVSRLGWAPKHDKPKAASTTKSRNAPPLPLSSRYEAARRDLLRTRTWTGSGDISTGTAATHGEKKQRHKHMIGSSRYDPGRILNDGDDAELEHEDVIVEALLQAGILENEMTHTLVTDMLWENQRGWWLVGSRFSSLALGPFDAKPWTTSDGSQARYTIFNHPLPTPAWNWHHSAWLIDMGHDVDAEGWQYSTRFGSKYWRGVPSIIFTVRRRLWVRSRYRPSLMTQDADPPHDRVPHIVSPACDSDIVNVLSNIPAHHLEPSNPFVSWYAPFAPDNGLNATGRTILHATTFSAAGEFAAPKSKEHIVHLNFVRAAKILIRHCQADRERVTYLQFWLGVEYSGTDSLMGIACQVDGRPKPPDIRDVYDLLEQRLDDILLLLEYQTSRKALLSVILELQDSNKGRAQDHYANRSAGSGLPLPSELSAQHDHGDAAEIGGGPNNVAYQEKVVGQGIPSPAFYKDVSRRIRDLDVPSGD